MLQVFFLQDAFTRPIQHGQPYLFFKIQLKLFQGGERIRIPTQNHLDYLVNV